MDGLLTSFFSPSSAQFGEMAFNVQGCGLALDMKRLHRNGGGREEKENYYHDH